MSKKEAAEAYAASIAVFRACVRAEAVAFDRMWAENERCAMSMFDPSIERVTEHEQLQTAGLLARAERATQDAKRALDDAEIAYAEASA